MATVQDLQAGRRPDPTSPSWCVWPASFPANGYGAFVVESVDAATARSCAFTAAVLAAEQTRACGHSMYQRSKLNRKASDGCLKSVGSEHARRRPVDGSGGGPDGDKVAAEVSADVEDRPVLDLMTPIEKGRVTD